jgi:hypothetical protein
LSSYKDLQQLGDVNDRDRLASYHPEQRGKQAKRRRAKNVLLILGRRIARSERRDNKEVTWGAVFLYATATFAGLNRRYSRM